MSAADANGASSASPLPTSGGLCVAVLGAGGTIAPAIVRDLAETEAVSTMRLLDINVDHAEHTAGIYGGGKAAAQQVDASAAGELAAALDGCDVLVNAASYRINLDAMNACLVAGCHYFDLGGLYWMTERQLELHDEFEGRGLLALVGIGSAPGQTNVMAARAVTELGGGARRIDVVAGGRDLDPPDGFAPPYALRTLIDELTLKPVVLRDGRPVEIEPLTDAGAIDFPAPIGEAPSIYTLHSELLTFAESFGCLEASFRLSLGPQLLERLKQLAEADDQAIARAAAAAVKPSPETVSIHMVDAYSDERRVRVTAITSPMREWNLGGSVVSTAAPAAAAVRQFARGAIVRRGVLPPERCIDPEDLFDELMMRGTRFEVTTHAHDGEIAPQGM
ncbi:MAG: saccharopine dehydrogenase NADP-binding domain-containing protein [Solirubrobacterales bacterium]